MESAIYFSHSDTLRENLIEIVYIQTQPILSGPIVSSCYLLVRLCVTSARET